MTNQPDMEVEALEARWDLVGTSWRALFDASRETSCFLSPTWVEEWLSAFGEQMRTRAMIWRDEDGAPAGCALISQTKGRVGPIPVSSVHLNTSGVTSLGCEHNDVLARPLARAAVVSGLSGAVWSMRPDELVLEGVRQRLFDELHALAPLRLWRGERSEAPYVDLDGVGRLPGGYLGALSSNTRAQIRRSIRRYESLHGEGRVELAASGAQGIEWLAELIGLHEQRWPPGGGGSAFDCRLRPFHEQLVERLLSSGAAEEDVALDLVRVRFGKTTIALLYNLRCRGRVYFYQSGLRYDEDPRLQPGLVAHALAIQNCVARGMDEYDFLGGEPVPVRYKRSLSTSHRPLYWARLSAGNLKMRLAHAARGMKHLGKGSLRDS